MNTYGNCLYNNINTVNLYNYSGNSVPLISLCSLASLPAQRMTLRLSMAGEVGAFISFYSSNQLIVSTANAINYQLKWWNNHFTMHLCSRDHFTMQFYSWSLSYAVSYRHSFSAKLSEWCPMYQAKCARAEIAKLSMHLMEVLQAQWSCKQMFASY